MAPQLAVDLLGARRAPHQAVAGKTETQRTLKVCAKNKRASVAKQVESSLCGVAVSIAQANRDGGHLRP
jgi:hypothetical protein